MFFKKIFLVFILSFTAISYSNAQVALTNNTLNKYIPNAQIVGETQLQFLIWNVYKAQLYAPNGIIDKNKPYALTLKYLINLDGKKISAKSAKEMKRIHNSDDALIQKWQVKMNTIFPDIKKGDTITGIRTEDGYSLFYKNDVRIGNIEDRKFTQQFFDIWLSEKTMRPDLRRELLGMQ